VIKFCELKLIDIYLCVISQLIPYLCTSEKFYMVGRAENVHVDFSVLVSLGFYTGLISLFFQFCYCQLKPKYFFL